MGNKRTERDVGEPLMLTYKEAAFKISVSVSFLYELLRDGVIRKLELGPQTMRIPLSECEAYLDRLKAEQWGPGAGEAA